MTDNANDSIPASFTDVKADAPTSAEPSLIAFSEFLESVSPSQFCTISDLYERKSLLMSSGKRRYCVSAPELTLHCAHNSCNGPRFFRYSSGDREVYSKIFLTYLSYVCSNCQVSEKIFSIRASRKSDEDLSTAGQCYKFGEYPGYGPPIPSRLLKLFGRDRDLFLKGRQCENHGLGIGAFVYYRRVVENHKNEILSEIIKVAKALAPEMVSALEAAKRENQFLKAVESVKDAIPQALLINGHNPLTLLHKALSEGVHAQSDEDCMESAHDVRIILAELTERLGQLLKDQAELNKAVSRLMAK